jgi:hypothetical protein
MAIDSPFEPAQAVWQQKSESFPQQQSGRGEMRQYVGASPGGSEASRHVHNRGVKISYRESTLQEKTVILLIFSRQDV